MAAIEQGDSLTVDVADLLARHGARSVQLVFLHPPYYDIIRLSDDPCDLSNAPSIEAFLERLVTLTRRLAPVLDHERYLVLVIGDIYRHGEWYPLGFYAMEAMKACGFRLKSILVKNVTNTLGKRRSAKLWRYRALAGGVSVFTYEYIFLLCRR